MGDLSLEDLSRDRKLLENEILKLVTDFESKYNNLVSVKFVSLEHEDRIAKPKRTYYVSCEIGMF